MKKSMLFFASVSLVLAATQAVGQTPDAPAAPAPAGASDAGALFKQRCGDCHEPAVGEAPGRDLLAQHTPDDLFAVMKTGAMMPMAAGLTDDQMKGIAAYLTAAATPAAPAEPAVATP